MGARRAPNHIVRNVSGVRGRTSPGKSHEKHFARYTWAKDDAQPRDGEELQDLRKQIEWLKDACKDLRKRKDSKLADAETFLEKIRGKEKEARTTKLAAKVGKAEAKVEAAAERRKWNAFIGPTLLQNGESGTHL